MEMFAMKMKVYIYEPLIISEFNMRNSKRRREYCL